jgi:hypothetical protein
MGTMRTPAEFGDDDKSAAAAERPHFNAQRAVREPEYGLYAVLACLLVLAALDGMAVLIFSRKISDAVAVLGAISSPIVAMVSAYFGVKVGARTGTSDAMAAADARRQAELAAKSLLGHMTPEEAKPLMRELGIPVAG